MSSVLHVKEIQKQNGEWYDWQFIGGMGQRMAVFYSSQADAGGNHYFAVIAVDDFGDPILEENNHFRKDDRFYLVWAVSSDGVNWYFERKNPNFSNCSNSSLYIT